MIETALEDAVMVRNGRPSWEALLAHEWLTAQPSHLDREAYLCSYRWCCEWLDIDADAKIAAALPLIQQTLVERVAQQTAPVAEQRTRLEQLPPPSRRHKAAENPLQIDLFACAFPEVVERMGVSSC